MFDPRSSLHAPFLSPCHSRIPAIPPKYNFADECWLTLGEVSVRSRILTSLLFICLGTLPSFAQRTSTNPVTTQDPAQIEGGDDARSRMASEMAKKATKERVAALRHDTDKLLKLSVELKEYVDKSDENVLSLDVIKKAEEIEKLARSVKDKMKGPN